MKALRKVIVALGFGLGYLSSCGHAPQPVYAQVTSTTQPDGFVFHAAGNPPPCDGWGGKKVGTDCVLTLHFAVIHSLSCAVNQNPTPVPGNSPVEIVCTWPSAAIADPQRKDRYGR